VSFSSFGQSFLFGEGIEFMCSSFIVSKCTEFYWWEVSSDSLCDHILDDLFDSIEVILFVVLFVEDAILLVSQSYAAKTVSTVVVTVVAIVHMVGM